MMLNVPTLWTVFIVNFLALGMIWAYILRSYPKLAAARFWTGSAFVAAAGASVSMARLVLDSPLVLLAGGSMMILAVCLSAMGIQQFYHRTVSWRRTTLIVGASMVAMIFFLVVYDNMPLRVLSYSTGQMLPLVLTLRLLFKPADGGANHGARLAGTVAVIMIALHATRVVANFFGADFSIVSGGAGHSFLVLAMLFLSLAFNFGLLLMVMDRLRNEVAELALMDDLTGVANRRRLLQRLTEECARSQRSGQSFALLVIDLDGFKIVNDTYGHAAGDACLQHFTLMAQTRLRKTDMLARTGGDEFCIVLPSSTIREGAMIAQRIVEVCRQDAQMCVGNDIPIAVSIGVAQWTKEIGDFPDRLIACADHALYAAKRNGKNDYAIYNPVPALLPEQGVEQRTEQGATPPASAELKCA